MSLPPTFVISLPHRHDRRKKITVALTNRNIPFQFWDAIQLQQPLQPFQNRIFFCPNQSLPHAACFLSHHLLIEKAYQNQYPGILIFEDDAYTMAIDAKNKILHALQNQPPQAYILYFEYLLYNAFNLIEYNNYFFQPQPNAIWGTAAYYLNPKGIQFYLQQVQKELQNTNEWKASDTLFEKIFFPQHAFLYRPKVAFQDPQSPSSMPQNQQHLQQYAQQRHIPEHALRITDFQYQYQLTNPIPLQQIQQLFPQET